MDRTATNEIAAELASLWADGLCGETIPRHLRERMVKLYDDDSSAAIRITLNPFQGKPGEAAFIAEPTPELLAILANLRALRPRGDRCPSPTWPRG